MEIKLKPFLEIWIRPREVIRNIVDTNPTRYVILLAAISGFFESLEQASDKNYGDSMSLIFIFIMALFVGSIFGIIGLYISGALVKWTGGWIGGEGTSEEIRAAIAWGAVPKIITNIILLIPTLLIFGRDLYSSYIPPIPGVKFFTIPLLLLGSIGGIWSLVVGLKCLGEVQGFSAWKALLNSILAGIVIFVPLIILVFMFAIAV